MGAAEFANALLLEALGNGDPRYHTAYFVCSGTGI